jgi:fatty-acyl-CoA synthase
VARHPDVLVVSVYGVPDAQAGDQVMAALVLREAVTFDGGSFAGWLDAQPDMGPKWRPRFVRLSAALPTTPSNKVLTRTLAHERFRSDRVGGDPVFVRDRGADAFRRFTEADESALRGAFDSHGRGGAWEL